ncbi:hypothetical protein Daus18300_013161 [Diaporthe australafricana]|uniref:Uncharacterized protein n=1 Tax=Diaporthe australafricana TaxID=127596 RepID=A0ABR3W046_9PEZI
MSGTTNDIKSGVNGLKINDAQQRATDTKPDTKSSKAQGDDFGIPAAPTAQHAENYDEAAPGVPGPDYSARDTLRQQAKPVFNRGPSMLDFTAVTSAGPTPAVEVPKASYFDGSRRRESHLPDDGAVETMRRQTVTETDSELPRLVPSDEVQGPDAFAPRTSRQETESGARDATSGWTGANNKFGSHEQPR